MKIRTLKDIPEIKGKRIILRVDYNVPLQKNGEIQDDTRIYESLETIKYLTEKGGRLIIISHLGRPKGEYKAEFRLTKIAGHLEKLLSQKLRKFDTIISPETKTASESLKDGEIMMLENIRCENGEEACDPDFTSALSKLGEIFVSDAFGAAHRAHASTVGLAKYLPAYAGLLMEREIKALSPIVEGHFKRPLTMIFGGAKIEDKLPVIRNFLGKADYFLIGGAMANTFLAAAGYNVGTSLYEEDKLDLAREIMMECEKAEEKFIIPHDVVVASEISDHAETANIPVEDVIGDMKILDIGKWTAEKYANIASDSATAVWNGPLGLFEYKAFEQGSEIVARTLAKSENVSIIGGGDTLDCIKRFNIPAERFTHISTGGGACIEFLSGQPLPGIEIFKKA